MHGSTCRLLYLCCSQALAHLHMQAAVSGAPEPTAALCCMAVQSRIAEFWGAGIPKVDLHIFDSAMWSGPTTQACCRWIGVDSFFIRENDDTCAVRDVLEPYERMGILNFALAPGPKYPLQTDWYNDCGRFAAKKHSWVAFIDIDEFMVVLDKCVPHHHGLPDPRPAPPPPHTHTHCGFVAADARLGRAGLTRRPCVTFLLPAVATIGYAVTVQMTAPQWGVTFHLCHW